MLRRDPHPNRGRPVQSRPFAACWSTGCWRQCSPMVRRNRPSKPLQPLALPTWLVGRDLCRQPLEWRQLAPGADLRTILKATRSERNAAGWVCSLSFAERRGERVQVGIERYDPAGPGPP
jgi:hypothetical protein